MSRREGAHGWMPRMPVTPPTPFPPSDLRLELLRCSRRLGTAIRTARNARGWTIQQAAQAARLSSSAVARLEGGRPGGLLTYLRLAEVLGLRLEADLIAPATALEA